MSDLTAMITRHEAVRLRPYLDCCGKYWRECICEIKGCLTIAVGVNLDAGITNEEAFYLRDKRITRARAAAATFKWFPALDEARQAVVVSMIFNMGLDGFCEFKRLIAAIEKKDYEKARVEMLSSRWASQVGRRAVELSLMMASGRFVV